MTERPSLLLIDDDEAITAGLGSFLERSGFTVRVAGDGRDGLAALAEERFDVAVCDVIMPHMDGREFVRRLRAEGSWMPVILLTAVGESYERSAALDEGADDYLNKPFDPQELLSRIRAVLRRSVPGERPLSAASRLRAGELELDRSARRVRLAGAELALTPKAVMLLDYLMAHPGEVHTRERLLSTLWGFDFAASTRAVDHRVAELRRLLDDDPAEPRFIETVQTLGYRFCAEVVSG
ncbi:Alkaline phosphatase synthesis transcriptional regulatory protein PhoP [Microbacterium lemovicicum]|uniref:Alkaline phosphatase synthesis transcriptional regulatory protein PhoP n=1 Tax=Microbacterium lemovicicum TaxID=1072463 RepID=A0A3S9W799_9MICO|nr:response regulator transcription factor [Microbacterium lemovicicum]AZS35925.1 Alkaline phosphatase synthesis transcriptional regulatory protein PhoP [Microbacterium lemovicicum]